MPDSTFEERTATRREQMAVESEISAYVCGDNIPLKNDGTPGWPELAPEEKKARLSVLALRQTELAGLLEAMKN